MGDGADHYTEIGEYEWFMHLAGECDGPCPYCEEEEKSEDTGHFPDDDF